jgi:hypothetical protein
VECDEDFDPDYDDLNTIAALRAGKRAMHNVTLTDYRIRMLYDPGAAFSMIGRRLWTDTFTAIVTDA